MKPISQAQIARELGIVPAYLCQLLTGAQKISYRLAYKWSKSMGKDMDWWLEASPADMKEYLFKYFSNSEQSSDAKS